MKNEYSTVKLQNGIKLTFIESDEELYSSVTTVILRGSEHNPRGCEGTYHYMEHMLGTAFERNTYGGFYKHIGMTDGMTVNKFFFIRRLFLHTDKEFKHVIDEIVHFFETKTFDRHILENERWMVHNECTSKIMESHVLKMYTIMEEMLTGRKHTSFGSNLTLDEECMINEKLSLRGNEVHIFIVNVPRKEIEKYVSRIGNIKMSTKRPKTDQLVPLINEGKYVINVQSEEWFSMFLILNPDPLLILYLLFTVNYSNVIEYKNKTYYVSEYNYKYIKIFNTGINYMNLNSSEVIHEYIEVYIYFLSVLFPMQTYITTNNLISFVSIIESDDIYMRMRPMLKQASKFASEFVDSFTPKIPNKIHFVYGQMDNMSASSYDNYNIDIKLKYKVTKYLDKVVFDIDRIVNYIDRLSYLEIHINYDYNIISTNTFLTTNRMTYLMIEIENIFDCGYIVFYILSKSTRYYTIYNEQKFIINCMFNDEKTAIETNLQGITFRDVYNIGTRMRYGDTYMIDQRNNNFHMVWKALKRLDLANIYKQGHKSIVGFNYKVRIMNCSKFVEAQKTTVMRDNWKLDSLHSSFEMIPQYGKWVVIKNESDDIVFSYIFIQYLYNFLKLVRSMRRIYMFNYVTSVGLTFYVFMIYVEVQDLRKMMREIYDRMTDVFSDINFSPDINMIYIPLIKLMIYYNLKFFKSQLDITNISEIKKRIDLEFRKVV